MKINDDKKADVLLSALEERYSALRSIRERVQSIGIWALGLLLGASGWIIQSDTQFTCSQKILGILGVVIAFIAVRFFYLEDLQKGFRGQQRSAVRIETVLGLFTPNLFDESGEPIYPESWKRSGTEGGDGKFFDSTYILLYVGAAFLVVAILFSSTAFERKHAMRQHQSTFYTQQQLAFLR